MEEQNQLRYFVYVRKSSEAEERQAPSIESQADEIERNFPNIVPIEVIVESRSAFKPYNRPAFADMVRRIEAGEADGIIAWAPNRLSRNEVDAAQLTWLVRQGVIKDLKFANGYRFDNSPQGIWMLQTFLSQAQLESATKGVDIKRGLSKKVREGWLPGEAPTGYLNTPDRDKGYKIVVSDPDRFHLMRKMFDLMLTGAYMPPQILEIANNKWGFRTRERGKKRGGSLSRSALYKIFTSPFYYGYFEYPKGSGQWHKGSQEPMITREEYDRIQALLGSKGKPAPHNHEFAYTGPMTCGECGGQVTAEMKMHCVCSKCRFKFSCLHNKTCKRCGTDVGEMQNPTIRTYTLYRCSKHKAGKICRQPSVNVNSLENQIENFLASIQMSQEYCDWAIKHLKKAHKLEAATQSDIRRSQQREYDSSSERLNKLLELRLNGELSEGEYKQAKEKELARQAEYKALLEGTERRQHAWLELSERTYNFARYARFWFAEAHQKNDLQWKRELLTALGSNLVLQDKKLLIKPIDPLAIIQQALKDVPEAAATFEPEKTVRFSKEKAQQAVPSAPNPRWFRG